MSQCVYWEGISTAEDDPPLPVTLNGPCPASGLSLPLCVMNGTHRRPSELPSGCRVSGTLGQAGTSAPPRFQQEGPHCWCPGWNRHPEGGGGAQTLKPGICYSWGRGLSQSWVARKPHPRNTISSPLTGVGRAGVLLLGKHREVFPRVTGKASWLGVCVEATHAPLVKSPWPQHLYFGMNLTRLLCPDKEAWGWGAWTVCLQGVDPEPREVLKAARPSRLWD